MINPLTAVDQKLPCTREICENQSNLKFYEMDVLLHWEQLKDDCQQQSHGYNIQVL